MNTILYSIEKEILETLAHETIKTADDLETLLLDIQEHDKVPMNVAVVTLLVAGAIARKRSIDYAATNKKAKDSAERLSRYNKWVSANVEQSLNPTVNLSMQLAYGIIDRAQYDAVMQSLNSNAQSSIATKQVATSAK